jgi:hypothetical protein
LSAYASGLMIIVANEGGDLIENIYNKTNGAKK